MLSYFCGLDFDEFLWFIIAIKVWYNVIVPSRMLVETLLYHEGNFYFKDSYAFQNMLCPSCIFYKYAFLMYELILP